MLLCDTYDVVTRKNEQSSHHGSSKKLTTKIDAINRSTIYTDSRNLTKSNSPCHLEKYVMLYEDDSGDWFGNWRKNNKHKGNGLEKIAEDYKTEDEDDTVEPVRVCSLKLEVHEEEGKDDDNENVSEDMASNYDHKMADEAISDELNSQHTNQSICNNSNDSNDCVKILNDEFSNIRLDSDSDTKIQTHDDKITRLELSKEQRY